MQSPSIVRVVIHKRWQVQAIPQLDVGMDRKARRWYACANAPAAPLARRAPAGRARRRRGSRGVAAGTLVASYFSQPANAALVQPSPEPAGASPSGLPP
jgi:hypothetical protein